MSNLEKENQNSELKEIEEDIKKFSKIAEIGKTDGGKEIIQALERDIVGVIDELKNKYKRAKHFSLICMLSKLSEKLDLYRVLTRAEQNKKDAKKEYEKRLKELLK